MHFDPPLVADAVGQSQESELAPETQAEKGLPFTDAFKDLKKNTAIMEKIAASEAVNVDNFRQMKDNGAIGTDKNDPATDTDVKAIIKMFTKQSEIMEKYTKHLEILEKPTKQTEPVEAVAAMIEQTHIQSEVLLATVEQEEDSLSKELQQQLETVLSRTEEALERLMERLKRKAAAGRASSKETAPGDPTAVGSSNGKT
ncbi:MAG: hypothetical protein Q9172_007017 [Xanthocarpia lactea]